MALLDPGASLPFTFFFTLALLCLSLGYYFVNQEVSVSYMDEVFHVPQVQRYCEGQFHFWDPKITTPPGLYHVSLALLSMLPRPHFACTDLATLRLLSLLFAALLFPVLYALRHALTPQLTLAHQQFVGWNALNLWLLPFSAFFYFLYYTDTLSTVLVLSSYYLAKREYYWGSALNNIVWLAFTAGTVLLVESGYRAQTPASSWHVAHWAFVQDLTSQFPSKLWRMVPYLLAVLAVLGLASVYGLVMGDQAHHSVSLHLAQWNYFAVVFCALALPMLAHGAFLRRTLLRPTAIAQALFAAGVSLACVHFGTMSHPFILSDNRHASFYIWRYFFQRWPEARYYYVPISALALLLLYHRLRVTQSAVWTTLFFLAVSLTLVPTPLLEFRYFILPVLIARMHLFPTRPWQLALETTGFLAIHLYVFYLFLFKPFTWAHAPGILQRFMW